MQLREDYLSAPGAVSKLPLPNKKVTFDPTGVEMTSPYYFCNAFKNCCERDRWTPDEIKAVMQEALDGPPFGGCEHFYKTIEVFCIFPEGYVVPRPPETYEYTPECKKGIDSVYPLDTIRL